MISVTSQVKAVLVVSENRLPIKIGEDLWMNVKGYKFTSTHRECTACGTMFKKIAKCTKCKDCRRLLSYEIPYNLRIYSRAKARAKELGRDFDIEVTDISVPTFCPILGIKLDIGAAKTNILNAPSIDRIDNSRGYVKGNIQIISMMANQMKSSASPSQLYSFAKWVMANYSENGFGTR